MKRRRRKKNPSTSTILVIGGLVAVAAVGGILLFEKSSKASPKVLTGTQGTHFDTQAAFTDGIPFAAFAQIRAGDCLTVVQGQAGFRIVGDVPEGDNVAMRVVSTDGSTLRAQSIDPRVPGSPVVTFGAASISGAGDC